MKTTASNLSYKESRSQDTEYRIFTIMSSKKRTPNPAMAGLDVHL